MATIEKEVTQEQSAATVASGLPRPYHWTRSKYEDAITRGVFGPNDRLELLQGVIVEKMPQSHRHQSAIGAMQEVLTRIFATGYWLRIQMPLAVNDLSSPEPDLAVVVGSWRDYTESTPSGEQTVLVVEISDSTLATDRRTKAALYAQAMIPEYWIVNVDARVLEVHRLPAPSEEQPEVFAYRQIISMTETDTVTPLALDGTNLRVADILP